MKTNEMEITRNGSVISKHPDGVVCTYDSRHRILKIPMEDGSIFKLFQERADSGTIRAEYRTELMTTMAPAKRSGVKPEDVKELLVGNILSGALRPNAARQIEIGGLNGLYNFN